MTTTSAPSCTAKHRVGEREIADNTLVDLPCGCQDVHYVDGTICFEHAHVECDATPKERP